MSDIPRHVRTVLSALQFRGRQTEGLHALSDLEWNDVLSLWEFHRCLVPLRLTCGDELPEWVRLQIDRRLGDNAARLERIKTDYSRFSNVLRAIGASHLVIKGFALWPGFVDHPRFRLQSDIDIYSPPESILPARDALMELGYEPEKGLDSAFADHLPSMVPKSTWKWTGNFYDPEMPVSFELHHSLWNERLMRLRPRGLDQFWLRRVERQLEGITFPALCEVDNFGYAALHLTRNLLRTQPSVYQIYELARFLHVSSNNQPFWEDWRATHHESLRRLEAISCHAAALCFACHLPDEIEREITHLPAAVKTWFDRFSNVLHSQQFHPRKDALWLHTSLVESARDRVSIIRERLLPKAPQLEIVDLREVGRSEQRETRVRLGRRAKFIAYFFSRLPFHLRMVPATLWSGVRFWWSTKGLGLQFWNFFAVSFLFDLGMFIFFFLYNIFLLDRGFREDFIGLTASANTIGSVAICIPSGILVQRAGLQKTLLICLTSSALLAGALALVTSKQAILILSFLLGAASTIWAVAIAPATARLTNDKNREIGFSLIFSSGIAVGLLGSVTASRLPGWLVHIYQSIGTVHAQQATLLIGAAIVAIGAAFPLHFDLPPTPVKKTYPRNAFLVRFLLVVAVWGLAAGVLTPFYTVYFSQYLHLRLERIGIVTSISQISQALAILAAPFIVKKYGLVPGIMYMQLATAISLGWLAAAHTVPAAVGLYIAYTSFQWMSEPAIYSLLMSQVAPSEQAGASALNFLVISLVQAFASAAAGVSFLRFGYPAVLGATAVVALASAVLFRSILGQKVVKVAERVTGSVSLH